MGQVARTLAKMPSAIVFAAAALMAAPSGAAVEIGQVAPQGGVKDCFGATLFLNPQVAAGLPSYAVPPGGGVLTQWSTRGGDNAVAMKLKVVNPTAPMTYRIVATDMQGKPETDPVLNTSPIRIPVSGGELLALWLPYVGPNPACYNGVPGDIREFRLGSNNPEPQVGDDFATNSSADGLRTNVAALLEPDCDHDGFGDQTQDPDLSTCGPGTTPPGTTPPGTTPTLQLCLAEPRLPARASQRPSSVRRATTCASARRVRM